MEALAEELRRGIGMICIAFYYEKDEEILLKAKALGERIQKFCSSFLQGNIYGMEDREYQELKQYVIQVLEDYLEALEQQDSVYMVDTLDYGLRELVNIYIDKEEDGREEDE
ncbi:MAG: hypothetical protein HFH49_03070 [Lachnospiraceae bacterium]|nr:hypothetical protein [Lachnospiraceae bacterium]